MARDGAPTRDRQTLDLPKAYATTDFSLVTLLATLGIQLVNHRGQIAKKGDAVEWREITSKQLDQLKIDFDTAVKRGLGEIAYGFAEHPHRDKTIKAFREARAQAEKGENSDIPDTFKITCSCGEDCIVDVYDLLARFAGYLFATRKYLADRRPKAPAKLRMSKGAGHTVIDPKNIR
jgi:hypothetical protein